MLYSPILVRAFHLALSFISKLLYADLTRLFHVVFSDDWGKVTVMDSKCCNVEEFGLLRTQA